MDNHSSSSTSDDTDCLDEKLAPLLPLHHPHSFLTAYGASSDTCLEDESSYFSRDGTGQSIPSTGSSHSQTSSCGRGSRSVTVW